tara:strand:+ start:222 stop:674 length:453 start_codon:yes stop_codon:yes gene_type:complete
MNIHIALVGCRNHAIGGFWPLTVYGCYCEHIISHHNRVTISREFYLANKKGDRLDKICISYTNYGDIISIVFIPQEHPLYHKIETFLLRDLIADMQILLCPEHLVVNNTIEEPKVEVTYQMPPPYIPPGFPGASEEEVMLIDKIMLSISL